MLSNALAIIVALGEAATLDPIDRRRLQPPPEVAEHSFSELAVELMIVDSTPG